MRTTWKPFFIWNGVNSRDMGVEVLNLPPIVRPERRVETVTVAGRHGNLHVDEGVYESFTQAVEFAIIDSRRIRQVFQWLVGSGEVIFSNEQDGKFEAYICNKLAMEKVFRQVRKAQVQFDCQPFKYMISQSEIVLARSGVITNPGTVESQPIITVFGRGAITVSIGGRSFSLTGIADYIVIDSRIQNAYREQGESMNRFMSGELPYFDVGENAVSWTGNVEKIVIFPFWRWI